MALTEVELLNLLSGNGGSVAASVNTGAIVCKASAMQGVAPPGSLTLEVWLRETSPVAAAEQLARALHTAARNRRTNVWFRGVVGTFFGLTLLTAAASVKHGQPPSGILVTVAPWLAPMFLAADVRNAAEINAALLLGQLGDERAVPTLASSWRPGHGEPRITATLLHLLEGPLREAQARGEDARRITAALRPLLLRNAALSVSTDLSDTDTDMLLATVRYIAFTGDLEDENVLRQVAQMSLHQVTETPNRALLRDAARLALSDPLPQTLCA